MASFQLKNFVSIAASMINRMKATQTVITDFNEGAIGRTLVEAPAIEIEELYQQAFNLVTAAIPISVYNTFNFPALVASAGSGLIRVVIASQTIDSLISAGTVFTTPAASATYVANSDTTIPAGSTFVDTQATASTTGAATNLASGAAFTPTPSITGFVSATNLSAFQNGRDAETPDERLIRFNDYISTLPRGTPAAIEYGLSTVTVTDAAGNVIEKVALKKVVEPYLTDPTQPIALVNAYIHNGIGSTSSALLAQANKIIAGYTNPDGTKVSGYKAAGIPCNISIAAELQLAVTGVLTIDDNYVFDDVLADVISAVFTYLQGLDISASSIHAELITLIKSVAGVTDITLSAPLANTLAGVGIKIMPGALNFTQAVTE